MNNQFSRALALLLPLVFVFAACSSSDTQTATTDSATSDSTAQDSTATDPGTTDTTTADETVSSSSSTEGGATSTFVVDVWADNWMAVYVNGELIGEDSVPITTERSFNAESFSFEATYPFTVGIHAKDFMETESGIEYIGEGNQQMGDGGLIAQVTDSSTGEVVASTSSGWSALVVQQAPLNKECEKDTDPNATCQSLSFDSPANWADASFDDSGWDSSTEWSEGEVSPKDGYDEISWDGAANLIWGTDLEIDNIILFRTTVSAP